MSNASDLVAGMSGEDIRQNGERLHRQFKKYSDAVAVIQSIWIYGADGRALVSSSVYPPPAQSYADRDFFVAHVKENVGIHYGQVYPSSFNNEPFFTISKRLSPRRRVRRGAGGFRSAQQLFQVLFGRGLHARPAICAHSSGRPLPRSLSRGAGRLGQPVGPQTGFRRTVAQFPAGGYYNSTSPLTVSTVAMRSGAWKGHRCTSRPESKTPPFATNGWRRWALISFSAFRRRCCC